ncbi:MAG: right-handed parallel beta-helix repeat-containing protein, partial [Deltaproteobacteria bacterium]|nr:right-handed parallel beta-helix repeat-containing protein [Deltaproteobacteria bacterium]
MNAQASSDYASLGNQVVSTPSATASSNSLSSFFSEENLVVTKETDALVPGTLRTLLLQAAGIRHNNPFKIVKISFDPSIRRILITKGNLPAIEEGLTQIDCADRVIIDGSQFDNRYLQNNETIVGLYLKSSGNTLKGCQITGFAGHALVLSGNRNQILNNKFGSEATSNNSANNYGTSPNMNPPSTDNSIGNLGSGIYFLDFSNDNVVENNLFFSNKQDGITFSAQAGVNNRLESNSFSDNGRKGINSNNNLSQSSRPILRSVLREGDGYLVSGTLNDPGEIEIFVGTSLGKEGKTLIVP